MRYRSYHILQERAGLILCKMRLSPRPRQKGCLCVACLGPWGGTLVSAIMGTNSEVALNSTCPSQVISREMGNTRIIRVRSNQHLSNEAENPTVLVTGSFEVQNLHTPELKLYKGKGPAGHRICSSTVRPLYHISFDANNSSSMKALSILGFILAGQILAAPNGLSTSFGTVGVAEGMGWQESISRNSADIFSKWRTDRSRYLCSKWRWNRSTKVQKTSQRRTTLAR